MNRIKSEVIKTINEIPDAEATTFEKLLEALCTRYQALAGLKDVENGNVMSIEELKKEVSDWK